MSQPKSREENGGGARLPMDIKHIKSLIDLMVENDLSRVELRSGDSHILLRRGHSPVVTGPAAPRMADLPAIPAVVQPAVRAPTAAQPAGEHETLIRSPMVGTFYASPDPESAPFVSVGSEVQPNTVVCLIEAMKVFNELKAEMAGRITKVLVKNAQAVEFDQPLFAVAPA